VPSDEAAQLADDSLRDFLASMAAAGNPGSGRHEIGFHKVHGWILEYDPSVGGSQIQAVIGVDGHIHARREPRSQRTKKLRASEWVSRETHDNDLEREAAAFAAHLARILDFDGVGGNGSDGN
jgi:hypothetical protein